MDWIKDILLYHEQSPLLFTQLYFWIFLTIVIAVYTGSYKVKSFRNIFLFAVSLFFYWKTGGLFLLLLVLTSLVDFANGIWIHKSGSRSKKIVFLSLSLLFNLGLLFYFKYAFFFIDALNQIFNLDIQKVNIASLFINNSLGTSFDITRIFLPVGISFYTFQSLSYVFDVFKGKLQPVKNFFDYGFFVTFFPQLVAGPIVRASQFIPQIYKEYEVSKEDFNRAVFLILNGLFKKMVISDYISINFVDRVFDNPVSFTGFENLMAVYGYGIQIYCDFSGYTDVAIGVALFLGFRLPLNFNSPYKAENISDFWKRWHISLTSWFRDYIFLPIAFKVSSKLSKNKYAGLKTDFIIYFVAGMITFVLTGFWHGAAWRFIIWGLLHGILLVGHRFWTINVRTRRKKTLFAHFVSVFLTFNLVSFAWIFFRVQSMQAFHEMMHQFFTNFGWNVLFDMIISYKAVFLIILFAYIVHWLPSSFKEKYRLWFYERPQWVKVIIALIVVFICYQAKSSDVQPFIYFQF